MVPPHLRKPRAKRSSTPPTPTESPEDLAALARRRSGKPEPPLPPLVLTDADKAFLTKLVSWGALAPGEKPEPLRVSLGLMVDHLALMLQCRPEMFLGRDPFTLEVTWYNLLDLEVMLRCRRKVQDGEAGYHPHGITADMITFLRLKRYPGQGSRTGVSGYEKDLKRLSRFYEEVRQLIASEMGTRCGDVLKDSDQTEDAWKKGEPEDLGTGIFLVFDPAKNVVSKVFVADLTYAACAERGRQVQAFKWVPRTEGSLMELSLCEAVTTIVDLGLLPPPT